MQRYTLFPTLAPMEGPISLIYHHIKEIEEPLGTNSGAIKPD